MCSRLRSDFITPSLTSEEKTNASLSQSNAARVDNINGLKTIYHAPVSARVEVGPLNYSVRTTFLVPWVLKHRTGVFRRAWHCHTRMSRLLSALPICLGSRFRRRREDRRVRTGTGLSSSSRQRTPLGRSMATCLPVCDGVDRMCSEASCRLRSQ